jgi:predicted MPP superfamily phosphohydrolase
MSSLSNPMHRQLQLTISTVMGWLGRDRFRPGDFDITEETVVISGLDAAFSGYRIVHITDLHVGHWLTAERLAGAIQLVNEQAPDLVAITGDFVSYVLDPIADDLVTALRQLRPRDAVVAVLGNHDHWLDAGRVRQILRESGVIELENDVYLVRRGEACLAIAGVDDVMVGKARLDVVLEKLTDSGAAVLLAHEPDFADVSAATGRFGLQLSGHTHGGQIVLPGYGPIAREPLFKRYPIGRYQVGSMVQYTNRGLGTHVLRLRVNCPPEITVITLKKSNFAYPQIEKPPKDPEE